LLIGYRPLPAPAARPWRAHPWRLVVLAVLMVAFGSDGALLQDGGFPVDVFVHDEQPQPTSVAEADARPGTDSQ
jgi:hypothetical protein